MRLFIGLPLSPEAAHDTQSLSARAKAAIPGRYVPAFNYHITLAFLGEVSEDRLDDAKKALSLFTPLFYAPHLALRGLSHFSHPSNAILIRCVHSPDDLSAMHDALVKQLRAHGLPYTDGPFSPHVTLARHADLSASPSPLPEANEFSFDAPSAVLYLSARDADNILRYTPLFSSDFSLPRF